MAEAERQNGDFPGAPLGLRSARVFSGGDGFWLGRVPSTPETDVLIQTEGKRS